MPPATDTQSKSQSVTITITFALATPDNASHHDRLNVSIATDSLADSVTQDYLGPALAHRTD